ncbi:MAG: phosphoadenylyl-sulfate reductase [Acidimicrobiales bacterium]|nr:phosphoadenylyl-sulfate reductase [Acidimicrobiales bacterium]
MGNLQTATVRATPVRLGPRAGRVVGAQLEDAAAEEIIDWAVETYGPRLCLTTSFANTVLVHLATRRHPGLDVIFLDTGFHFAETLATMREAFSRYQLNLTVVRPEAGAAELWAAGSTTCCEARKVEPLDRAMTDGGFDAWLSGLRRADGPTRATATTLQTDRHGRTKINPLVRWTDDDVAAYADAHDLVVNPLVKQGYGSIGCWPCTEPAEGRDGRWAETTKTECGLHLPLESTTEPAEPPGEPATEPGAPRHDSVEAES